MSNRRDTPLIFLIRFTVDWHAQTLFTYHAYQVSSNPLVVGVAEARRYRARVPVWEVLECISDPTLSVSVSDSKLWICAMELSTRAAWSFCTQSQRRNFNICLTLLSRDKFVSEQGCKATEATWFSGGGWWLLFRVSVETAGLEAAQGRVAKEL